LAWLISLVVEGGRLEFDVIIAVLALAVSADRVTPQDFLKLTAILLRLLASVLYTQ
jgi:hypothetical protein